MPHEKILIVEDEPIVALQLKENLERLGYSVPGVVDSGSSVVPSVVQYKPDLLLVDVHLRDDDDGIEAAYRAKAEFGVPVIFLTAYSDAETLRRAACISADAFLLKPYNEQELAANVKIALAKAKSDFALKRELLGAVSIIGMFDEPILILDVNETIVGANRAAAEYIQSSDPSRLNGIQLSRLLSPDPKDFFIAGVTRRIGGASSSISIAKREKLMLADGRIYGELVILGGVERRHKKILEASAVEANAYLQSLLPDAEAAGPDYFVAGFLCPCLSGTGDFYNVIRINSTTVAFYGLDVVGRGILATLLAFSVHNLVSVMARAGDGSAAPPEQVVSALQTRYARIGCPSLSMVYGTIDSATGVYRISRVGRMPTLQLTAEGSNCKIDCSESSPADTEQPTAARGILERGDRLIVASCGLMGVFGREFQTALKSFEAVLKECSGGTTAGLVDTIRRRTEREGPRAEEACLLIIERKA